MNLDSKIGWRKSNLGRFWLGIIAWLVKGVAVLCTYRKETTEYDLLAAQCFWLAHHNDSSRWFVISPQTICCPSFSFMGGVAKEHIPKRGCEKYFRRATHSAQLEMLLCVIPLITFTEDVILILNINKGKKGFNTTCAFLYFVSSLFFCTFREFCTPLLLLLCYCTLVPRTVASTLHNRISFHLRLIFT